jgi:hypothetical protein
MRPMIVAVAMVAGISTLAVSTPAAAQTGVENKNAACVAKCNQERAATQGKGGGRSAGFVRSQCIKACPNK